MDNNKDKKVISFRVTDNIATQLKEITEDFPNKESALNSLINAYKLQGDKSLLPDKSQIIDDYTYLSNRLQNMFIESLKATEDIKIIEQEKFNNQLENKDIIINDLQEKIKKLESKINEYEIKIKDFNNLKDRISELEKHNTALREDKSKFDKIMEKLIEAESKRKETTRTSKSTQKTKNT